MRVGFRAVALMVVVGLGLVGTAGVASATNPVGSAAWCKHHPHSTLSACHPSTGGKGGTGGTGTGGDPLITVTVVPGTVADPLMETGTSEIRAVVEVETSPSFSDDPVLITSLNLALGCGGVILFGSRQTGAIYSADSVQVVLDSEGNATVSLYATDCAPGLDSIEADLAHAPYYSVLGTIDIEPPGPTPAGVTGSPADEVETGNTTASGASLVYAVFSVEADPVYAEQTVQISSNQLVERCGGTPAPVWISNQGSTFGPTATATIDDDGNATFAFTGTSCAPGPSLVTTVVEAGTDSPSATTFTIVAPTTSI
jgi:hypothetical protein